MTDVLGVLRHLMETAFDADNDEHRAMLIDIWNALLAPAPPPSPLSPDAQWKSIGFQRDTPESDLRGAGVLALHHLRYLAITFTPELLACIDRQKARTEKHYPVATASISITRLLCILLGLTRGMTSRPLVPECTAVLRSIVVTPEDTCHLHARLLLHLDREYVENPESSYLTFNETSERVRDDVEAAAAALHGAATPLSVDAFMARVIEQRAERRRSHCTVA